MPDEPASTDDLRQQNTALQARLDQLKGLEEDLMAKRVFDKARGYLFSWITIGGFLLTLSGLVGLKATYDYIHDLVTKKVDAISEEKVRELLEKMAESKMEQRINVFIESKKTDFDLIVTQKIQQVAVSSAPLRMLQTTTEARPVDKTAIDHAEGMMPIRDGGPEGSVVGFALASTLEFQIVKTRNKKVVLSPRQLYYYARVQAGTADSDSGALIKDGIAALTTVGAVEESAWPYKAGEFGKKPPPGAEKSETYKITGSKPLLSLDDIKRALNETGPVVAGITIFDSFTSEETAKTGLIPMPKANGKILGGHAICIVGYDDRTKRVKFKNNWGSEWGDKGYGYLPYEYIQKYVADAWSFKLKTT